MSAKVANIVFSQKYENQTSSFSTTTIYTPTADALMRLNVFVDSTLGGGSPTFSYTDERGTPRAQTGTSIFRTKGGQPIQLAFVVDAGDSCNLYVVLEKLD